MVSQSEGYHMHGPLTPTVASSPAVLGEDVREESSLLTARAPVVDLMGHAQPHPVFGI